MGRSTLATEKATASAVANAPPSMRQVDGDDADSSSSMAIEPVNSSLFDKIEESSSSKGSNASGDANDKSKADRVATLKSEGIKTTQALGWLLPLALIILAIGLWTVNHTAALIVGIVAIVAVLIWLFSRWLSKKSKNKASSSNSNSNERQQRHRPSRTPPSPRQPRQPPQRPYGPRQLADRSNTRSRNPFGRQPNDTDRRRPWFNRDRRNPDGSPNNRRPRSSNPNPKGDPRNRADTRSRSHDNERERNRRWPWSRNRDRTNSQRPSRGPSGPGGPSGRSRNSNGTNPNPYGRDDRSRSRFRIRKPGSDSPYNPNGTGNGNSNSNGNTTAKPGTSPNGGDRSNKGWWRSRDSWQAPTGNKANPGRTRGWVPKWRGTRYRWSGKPKATANNATDSGYGYSSDPETNYQIPNHDGGTIRAEATRMDAPLDEQQNSTNTNNDASQAALPASSIATTQRGSTMNTGPIHESAVGRPEAAAHTAATDPILKAAVKNTVIASRAWAVAGPYLRSGDPDLEQAAIPFVMLARQAEDAAAERIALAAAHSQQAAIAAIEG